jgi:hypothetical protein
VVGWSTHSLCVHIQMEWDPNTPPPPDLTATTNHHLKHTLSSTPHTPHSSPPQPQSYFQQPTTPYSILQNTTKCFALRLPLPFWW